MATNQAAQALATPSSALIGRSFVLGTPDRQGRYQIGLQSNVWKIPAGGYAMGDRVKIVAIDNDVLSVERVSG
jgi:membrane protein implicated in regulation of membrane protease activity